MPIEMYLLIGALLIIAFAYLLHWSVTHHPGPYGWFLGTVRVIGLGLSGLLCLIQQWDAAAILAVFFVCSLADSGQESMLWRVLVEGKRRQRGGDRSDTS